MTRPVTTTSAPEREARGDAERAEIGVGGERFAEAEFGGARAQVVALDVRDRDVETEPVGQLAHRGRQPGRVQPAGVHDDRHAALERRAERVLELAQERLGVAEVFVAHRSRARISMVSSAR